MVAVQGIHSIGKQAAIDLFNSNWWIGKSDRDIVGFQLFVEELSCPFGVFHEAIEGALGRSVWTQEFGLNYDGLVREFVGIDNPPTMEEIIDLIPEDKRIIVMG